MNDKISFYICNICKNVIELIDGDIKRIKCCNQEMQKLIPNSVDAAIEKHVPVYTIENDELIVTVGSNEHPMEEDHYIMWIALVQDNRVVNRVNLKPGEKPQAKFKYLENSTIYAYCNKHGLWKKDVE